MARNGSTMLPTVASRTWLPKLQRLMYGLPAALVPAVLTWLQVALLDGLAGRIGGVSFGLLGILLARHAGPADAEVDDSGLVVEGLEDLDGVVGHLLQAQRAGGAVLVAKPEREPPVRRAGDDLAGLEELGQALGGIRDHTVRCAHGFVDVVAGCGPDRVDDRDDLAAQVPTESLAGREHVCGRADPPGLNTCGRRDGLRGTRGKAGTRKVPLGSGTGGVLDFGGAA